MFDNRRRTYFVLIAAVLVSIVIYYMVKKRQAESSRSMLLCFTRAEVEPEQQNPILSRSLKECHQGQCKQVRFGTESIIFVDDLDMGGHHQHIQHVRKSDCKWNLIDKQYLSRFRKKRFIKPSSLLTGCF